MIDRSQLQRTWQQVDQYRANAQQQQGIAQRCFGMETALDVARNCLHALQEAHPEPQSLSFGPEWTELPDPVVDAWLAEATGWHCTQDLRLPDRSPLAIVDGEPVWLLENGAPVTCPHFSTSSLDSLAELEGTAATDGLHLEFTRLHPSGAYLAGLYSAKAYSWESGPVRTLVKSRWPLGWHLEIRAATLAQAATHLLVRYLCPVVTVAEIGPYLHRWATERKLFPYRTLHNGGSRR